MLVPKTGIAYVTTLRFRRLATIHRETSVQPDNAIAILDELFDRLLQLAFSTVVVRNIILHPYKENGKQFSMYIHWSIFLFSSMLLVSTVNPYPVAKMSFEKTCIDASLVKVFDVKPSNPISKDLAIEDI